MVFTTSVVLIDTSDHLSSDRPDWQGMELMTLLIIINLIRA